MSRSRGFTALALLLVVLGIAIVVGTGWYATRHVPSVLNQAVGQTATSTASTTTMAQTEARGPSTSGSLPTRAEFIAQFTKEGFPMCYYQDQGQVFMQTAPSQAPVLVAGADLATFTEFIGFNDFVALDCFGKDAAHVYRNAAVFSGMDPATFKALWVAGLATPFYQSGTGIVKLTYGASTCDYLKGCRPLISISIVSGGDAATFQFVDTYYDRPPFAKDMHNVYCMGSILSGADPATATSSPDLTHLLVTVNGQSHTYDAGCNQVAMP